MISEELLTRVRRLPAPTGRPVYLETLCVNCHVEYGGHVFRKGQNWCPSSLGTFSAQYDSGMWGWRDGDSRL